MKWIIQYALIIFAFLANTVSAQLVVDCGNPRFDTEVFSAIDLLTDVDYGANATFSGTIVNLTMDVYQPQGDTMNMRPLIIWAHGGSFVGGTKNDPDVTELCQRFARRGYVCASIDYRLGLSNFPPDKESALAAVFRAVQDMKAAVRFFRKDAATLNYFRIDPNVIFVGGSSAGAFTALHLAYLDQPTELPSEIDTLLLGGMEGWSGNQGYSSAVNAVINLCGALGDESWITSGDIPFASMHGTADGTVPYSTAMIYMLNIFPIMVVDGSYSISGYANGVGVYNEMYTYHGADHVPYLTSQTYMDTTVKFVSNFLYRYFNCTPSDPTPVPNTFTTGINDMNGSEGIVVYPNPASQNVTIQSPKTIIEVEIRDLIGRRIGLYHVADQRYQFDLSHFEAGTYFIVIHEQKGSCVRKLVKE